MAETTVLKDVTESDDADNFCAPCKTSNRETIATIFCRNCNEFQCGTCVEVHKKFSFMSKHTLVKSCDKDTEFDMKGMDRCEKHGKRLKFYCKTEEKLCCSICAISSHLNCGGVGEIDSFTSINKAESKDLEQTIKKCLHTSSVFIASASSIKQDLIQCKEDKIKEIENMKRKVIQRFDDFKLKFVSKADKEIRQLSDNLDKETANSEGSFTKFKEFEKLLEGVTKSGSDMQIFTVIKVLKSKIENYTNHMKDRPKHLSTLRMGVPFNQKLSALIEGKEDIATTDILKHQVVKSMEIKLMASADIKGSEGGSNEKLYTGLDFLSDNRIVAVDFFNSTCVIMKQNLSVVAQIILERKFPNDITVLSKDEVAITHSDISVYKFAENHTLTCTRTLKTKESYFTVSAVNGDTLVGGTTNGVSPAKIITLSGEERDFEISFPRQEYGFNESKTTFIPKLNILVLTEKATHRCYIWNVKSKTSIVVEDDQIHTPSGVCATQSGLIFICSAGTDSIVQVSPFGKVLGSFKLNMKYPCTVAVSRDNTRLVVFNSCRGAFKLQLFELQIS